MSTTIVSILSGLGGMFGWGVSDYFANLGTDKVGNRKAFFWSQLAGSILIIVALAITAPSFDITQNPYPFVLLSGLGYTLGYLYLYKAFEVGNVSVVSVVINFNAVLTMMVAYFVYGQRLEGIQVPAVLLIILGVMLVSVDFKDLMKGKRNFFLNGVKEAIIASIGFGIFHWPVTEYIVERADWLWTALLAKIISILLIIALAIYSKKKLTLPRKFKNIKKLLVVVGVLEALAVLSVNFGYTIGDSILIAPIANSVAIVTVTMAIIFLKEKVTKPQIAGILMAVVGIIMTAL